MKFTQNKPFCVMDLECYPNFFLASFKRLKDGKVKHFVLDANNRLDVNGIVRILRNHTIITFNGNHYDIPVLKGALKVGATNKFLKKINDYIIVGNHKFWQTQRHFDLPRLDFLDHIDIKEVMPAVGVSLKLYGGRLHSKRLQDLPYDPALELTEYQKQNLIKYCENDLDTTIDCFNHCKERIDLRYDISNQISTDVRSKSDAQIAEAILTVELTKSLGHEIEKPLISPNYTFKYQPPEFLKFETPELQEFFNNVCNSEFKLKKDFNSGSNSEGEVVIKGVEIPKCMGKVKFRNMTYKFGVGGIHSTEKSISHYSDEYYVIIDNDVASYYPAILINGGYYPKHLGDDFIKVYSSIRERRIAAKKAKNKTVDSGLKIVLNGTFGKLGSRYSKLFAPNLMIQVTVTGQLALLMLIERFELAGIEVISANTDGVVSKCPRDKVSIMQDIVKQWEIDTNFVMEPCEYSSMHSQGVNAYLAFKPNGEVKQKGFFAFVGSTGYTSQKNPVTHVCIDAVINYLRDGTPLEDTIEWCNDVRRFLVVRQVTGGCEYRDDYLGKVARWYYAEGSEECLHYAKGAKKEGHKVNESQGAKPLMVIPDRLPNDIDLSYYVERSKKMLMNLGVDYD